MKRIAFWLLSAFLLFVFGAAATLIYLKFFYVQHQPLPEIALPKVEADSAESPPLTFCDLANNPERYHGQTVRLAAKLNNGLEGSWFSDNNCGIDNAAIVSAEDNKVWEAINKVRARKKGEPWDNEVDLVVLGTFKNTAYQDCCLIAPFQFEILKVEKASKVK